MNTKKDIFQKHKYANRKLKTPRNRQHVHNALTPRKSVPGYFKDVKTEETFSSQDQKLVETTICDNFIGIKTLQREFANARIATLVELNKWLKFSTSKQLYQPATVIKNGKTCNEKNRITDRHIKRNDSRKKKLNQ